MFADRMPRATAADLALGGRSAGSAVPLAAGQREAAREKTRLQGAGAASNLRAWHGVDWRFLLPDPNLGSVWLAPDCTNEQAALGVMGIDVRREAADRPEVAFVDEASCDFHMIEGTLPPGALVRITVGAGGRDHSRRRGRWGIAEELAARGWQVLGRVWTAGGIEAPLAYVDRDNRLAVTSWWRTLEPKGARARLTIGARLMLARIGFWRLPCHEGYVFARTPT